jgi:hypothetical protein
MASMTKGQGGEGNSDQVEEEDDDDGSDASAAAKHPQKKSKSTTTATSQECTPAQVDDYIVLHDQAATSELASFIYCKL